MATVATHPTTEPAVAAHPVAADPTVAPAQAPPAQVPHAAETTSVPPETSTNGHGPREEVDPKVIKEREKQQKQCVQLELITRVALMKADRRRDSAASRRI